ncbi:MAG: N-acetylglucosamine-6-phosphate deacetylase [Anaerolineae bacterium]
MLTRIVNGIIITPHETLPGQTLTIRDTKIDSISPTNTTITEQTQDVDASNCYIIPGFIDVHVHGAAGHDTMHATPDAIYGMAEYFARHGVTSFYPTTMTMPAAAVQSALDNLSDLPQPTNGAQILGAHVEGPYLNLNYKGAQPPDYFRLPDPAEYQRWLETGMLKLMTVAPEIDGALEMISALRPHQVEFALGHSGATYDQSIRAFDSGVHQVTHTFNGMIGLHHREPGALGAVLTDDRVYAQLIADGIHVHPGAIRVLLRAKGHERVMLITDSMEATGLSDGTYDLGGQTVTVQQGIARIANGSLAGSTLTMDQAVRNIVSWTDLPLNRVIQMATAVPAAAMHLAESKGHLRPGYDADIVLLNRDLQVVKTFVAGKLVYST